jgi:starvation-inducible DNA-binding protein
MFFPQLHQLFKDQYQDLWDAYDRIGENIRKLDAFTPASLSEYLKFSIIDDQTTVLDATGYVQRLLMDHERMIQLLTRVFALAEAQNLQDHMNFIAERLDSHSKMRWMLKTLLNSVAKLNTVDTVIKI